MLKLLKWLLSDAPPPDQSTVNLVAVMLTLGTITLALVMTVLLLM